MGDAADSGAAAGGGPARGGKRTVTVKVLYFARSREVSGRALETWRLEEGATTKDLEEKLVHKYEGLKELTGVCAWAVNEEYVDDSQVLADGDEVAIIPPISGG
ncbi:Molybdopterin synthase sulfur carrier subunit [Hondaea fermentalgiana]|uniref:Molybdopterin synthase sulfur carrier subunit n=1 Tax=Hondaea fermentalgiana TaxID=2315210 RepID=A0A2R5G3F4_9STRA|nr:Molybdopterin synthase sulfur carrier subunit [Hondaea fermentalgiana]|eukprot:GBG25540.1 Molybdopterin synthase sulfur carrier subunit [Hondaea fermentalgiana]